MVKDVVEATFAGNLSEIRMSSEVLDATLELRAFLFTPSTKTKRATPSSRRPPAILGGLWEKIRERPWIFSTSDCRRGGH